MTTPTRAKAQEWANLAQALRKPIRVKFEFTGDHDQPTAKENARRLSQAFNAMRATTRDKTRKVQKNSSFPGPYDDVMCWLGMEPNQYVVTIQIADDAAMEDMWNVEIGE